MGLALRLLGLLVLLQHLGHFLVSLAAPGTSPLTPRKRKTYLNSTVQTNFGRSVWADYGRFRTFSSSRLESTGLSHHRKCKEVSIRSETIRGPRFRTRRLEV